MKHSNSRLGALCAGALLIALLVGCDGASASPWGDGSFSGTGEGVHGPVEVSVVVADGEITEISIVAEHETEGVSDLALEEVPAKMIEA